MLLYEPIFQALNERGVRYVVVGGVAVVLHGHVRLTADLDIAIDLSPEMAKGAVDALTAMGLKPRAPVDAAGFADPEIRKGWARDRGMVVFSMWDPENAMRTVDLFIENPVAFEDLWERSIEVDLSGTSVRVAAIPDLISLKRMAGRTQDLEDIAALEIIRDERQEP